MNARMRYVRNLLSLWEWNSHLAELSDDSACPAIHDHLRIVRLQYPESTLLPPERAKSRAAFRLRRTRGDVCRKLVACRTLRGAE